MMPARLKKNPTLVLLPFMLTAFAAVHCGDAAPEPSIHVDDSDGGSPDATASSEGGPESEPDKPLVPATKVDLLFVVDNSAAMGDKQALLSSSVGRILRRLTEPTSGHAAIADVHVGVISTSLGTMGGDICPTTPNARANDMAHLRNVAAGGAVVKGAEQGFLAYGPGGIADIAAVEKATADIIGGVGQTGCGFEAQLESMYRFVAQPDPPLSVALDASNIAHYAGVDFVVLEQRKAFLRPDSAVAIVMLTDEDDSNVDPRSVRGQGWAFTAQEFPGSKVSRGGQGTTAARGTEICATNPTSPACMSCGFVCDQGDSLCLASKNDPNCKAPGEPGKSGPGYDGYSARVDDDLNVRFHRMKQRFGVDPQFPIERYVRALTSRKVPNRDTEHPAGGAYTHAATCTNPLFAASLPSKEGEELCNLPEGARSRELVFFGLIGGVPQQLLAPAPDWTKILGANPDAYDETGIDPHMIQSTLPRAGLSGADLPPGAVGTDPIHGREWQTAKRDLQYACTFDLPAPRVCDQSEPSCACGSGSPMPPLCNGNTQVKARSFPTPRELRVAKGLGNRAVVASICPPDTRAGYGPLFEALADRMAGSLAK